MARMVDLQDLLICNYLLYILSFYSQKNRSMSEKTVNASAINLRNKGIKTGAGKLHKGCVKDAFTKLSIGSIPSNYQSIIYHHEERKGFGTSQTRFIQNKSEIIKTELQESNNKENQITNLDQKCYSSKGFGPLIAKEKRQWVKFTNSPGPGNYLRPREEDIRVQKFNQKGKRKCYTRQREDFKIRQLKINKENEELPCPGFYDVSQERSHALIGWKSSFMTKLSRDTYIPKMNTPGPGCYNDQDKVKQASSQKREVQEEEYFKKLVKQKKGTSKYYIQKRKHLQIPGPGAYDSEIPNFKPLYQKIKISHNFIQNSRDRFNDPEQKKTQDNSGPNALTYEIPSSFDKIEKKMIYMPCFMSQSCREPFKGNGMGPSLEYDVKQIETNFHFNIRGKWV